jgi:hypothetical protein
LLTSISTSLADIYNVLEHSYIDVSVIYNAAGLTIPVPASELGLTVLLGPGSITNPLPVAVDGTVPISGTVSVGNTVAVSGTVDIGNTFSTAVPVSVINTVLPVSGDVTISSQPISVSASGTFPVTISGTVDVGTPDVHNMLYDVASGVWASQVGLQPTTIGYSGGGEAFAFDNTGVMAATLVSGIDPAGTSLCLIGTSNHEGSGSSSGISAYTFTPT